MRKLPDKQNFRIKIYGAIKRDKEHYDTTPTMVNKQHTAAKENVHP